MKIRILFLITLTLFVGCYNQNNQLNDLPTAYNINDYHDYISLNAPSDKALRKLELLLGYYQQKKDYQGMITTFNRYKVLFETRNPNFVDITNLIRQNDLRYIVEKEEIDPKMLKITPRKEILEDNARLFFDANLVDTSFSSDSTLVVFCSDANVIGEAKPLHYNYDGNSWGNTDIFIAYKKKDGTWSEPFNIGTRINTPYAERTPFLSRDKNYLFFASNKPGGFGGFDIYMAKRLSNRSLVEWSQPINLGKYINTPKDEFAFQELSKNLYKYYSNIDFTNPELYRSYNAKYIPIIDFSAKVVDTINTPLDARIFFNNNDTLLPHKGSLYNDYASGYFNIKMSAGTKYNILIEKDGYTTLYDSLDLYRYSDSAKIHKVYTLKSLPKKLKIITDTIVVKKVDTVIVKSAFNDSLANLSRRKAPDDSIKILDFDDYKFVRWNILSNKKYYIVQVSSWDNQEKALNVARNIKNKGFPIVVRKALLFKNKLFYRVQVDIIFNSLNEANDYANKHFNELYDQYTINKKYYKKTLR